MFNFSILLNGQEVKELPLENETILDVLVAL